VARWPKDRRCLLPPLSSGGALVANPSLRFHIPLIEPDVRISRIRLSDKTHVLRAWHPVQLHTVQGVVQGPEHRRFGGLSATPSNRSALPSLSRVTPSATSERLTECLGFPISSSRAACCVSPELRSLSSTGITRLPQYYGPLRHPRPPGPSLTGVRLSFPRHEMGLPVLRALPLCTCSRHYPGTAPGCSLRSLHQTYQPSPKWRSGRPVQRPFRGLLSVHSR